MTMSIYVYINCLNGFLVKGRANTGMELDFDLKTSLCAKVLAKAGLKLRKIPRITKFILKIVPIKLLKVAKP